MINTKSEYRNSKLKHKSTKKNLKSFSLLYFANLRIASCFRLRATKFSMRGTTLIELLLYIGLLSVFIAVLTGLFGTAIEIFLSSQSDTGLTNDKTYIFQKLNYDLKRADGIILPALQGDSSTALTISIDGINYSYSSDVNGNLVYTNNLGSFNLNSYLTNISAIQFTKLGNSGGFEETVKIQITLRSKVNQAKGIDEESISTTIALHRN